MLSPPPEPCGAWKRVRPSAASILPRGWPGILALALAAAACGGDSTGAVPACADATPLEVPDTVPGRLTSADDRLGDSFVDYYGLRVDRTVVVELTLTSTELDPLVVVLNDLGEVDDQDFDPYGTPPGEEETARLTRTLDPGCQLVGASAYTADTTGAYTLTVTETAEVETP